jgi:hypothetical protein
LRKPPAKPAYAKSEIFEPEHRSDRMSELERLPAGKGGTHVIDKFNAIKKVPPTLTTIESVTARGSLNA